MYICIYPKIPDVVDKVFREDSTHEMNYQRDQLLTRRRRQGELTAVK